MARVILKDHAANTFSLFAAKLGPVLGRPAKYNEAAEILGEIDEAMLTTLVHRYNAVNTAREPQST